MIYAIDGELLRYFTIALKPLTVREETVSNIVKKKLLRISELDEETQTYTMSAYLITQLGKNFANGTDKRITGEELLEATWNKIEEMQYHAGGVVTFLEEIMKKNCYLFIMTIGFKNLILEDEEQQKKEVIR